MCCHVCVSFQSVTFATKKAQVTFKFDSYDEADDIEDYLERLELFLKENNVEEEKRSHTCSAGYGQRLTML